MADSINVGILTAILDVLYKNKGMQDFRDDLTKAGQKVNYAEKEIDKLKSAFTKLSASLDPVVAKEVKRQKEIDLANRSLKEGIIDNEKYNRTLKQIDASLDQLDRNKGLRNLANIGSNLSSVGADLTKFITLPLLAIGVGSTKVAIDFESSFAGVRKTVDATEQEFAQLSRGLRDLAAGPEPIPIDVNKLNQIAESAGQLGIAKNDILDFTRTVANLGATTNLSLEEASEGIAKFQNIFGAPGQNVDRLGSTIVDLGNKSAATEKQILEMGLRIAGAGHQIDLTQGEVLAFATSLSSVGIEAEAGGSAVSKVMIEIGTAVDKGGRDLNNFAKVAGMSASDFSKLFKEDAAQAINQFILGLHKVGESGGSVFKVLEELGITEIRQRDALLRLAGAGDLLTQSLEVQALAWSENNALAEEARKRYQTTESQITISINRIKDKAIDLGTSLLPIVKAALDAATPIVDLMGNIASSFSGMPPISQGVIVSAATLLAGLGPVLFISGQLIQTWTVLVGVAPKLGTALTIATGPVGAIALALIAAAGAATIWINKWREASEEATRIAVQLGNLEGAALSFYKSIKASEGKITSTALSTAWEDADRLARALVKAQGEVNKLKKQIKEDNFFSPADTAKANEALKEAENNVKTLSGAYEKQKAGLRGVKEVIDVTAPAVSGLTGDLDLQTKAGDKLSETLADLERQYINQVRLRKLASIGVESTNKEKDNQKAIETVLRIQNQLKSDGLSLTQQQIDRIKFLVIGTEEEKRLEDAIIKAREKIGTLAIEYLDTVEKINKELKEANPVVFTLFEQSTKKALDYLDKMIPRLDLVGKKLGNVFNPNISIDLLQRINSLVEDTATAEEKRALALARSVELMKIAVSLGVLTPSQAATVNRRVGQDNANPLFDESQQELYNFAGDVLSTFRTINDDVNEYIARVRHAVDAGFLSVAQGEETIARIREERLVEQAQGWTTLFSTLSNMFGGFGSTAINVINQMISTYQAFQSAGSAVGGQWGSMISSAGPFFAIAGAIISGQRASAARDRAQAYTSTASLGFETGGIAEATGRRGRELANALENALKPIMDLMGRTLDILPEITISAREDGRGFAAHVNDIFIGYFATMEDAIDAASVAAFESILSSLPESIRTAITNSGAVTSDDIKDAIQFALDYDNIGLSQIAIDLKNLFRQFSLDVQQADKYGLDEFKFVDKLTQDINKIAYQLMGVDTSTSDALQNLVDINNVLKEQTAQLRIQREQRLQSLKEELLALGSGPRQLTGELGRTIQETPEAWARTREAIEREISRITGELDKLPTALADTQINSTIFDQLYKYLQGNKKYAEEAVKYAKIKVEIEFALIRARLEELGKWEQFAGMFTDAYNAAMNLAGRTGRGNGGGGGSNVRQDARDFIKDRTFQLRLADETEYNRRRLEIQREYQTQLDEIGNKDKGLRAEIIALRERELAQLEEEKRKKTIDSFQSFIGVGNSQFDQIRKTANNLIQEIEDSPFGSPRKARMIARVLAEVDEQVKKLSEQKAITLFGQMLADMQAFGATDKEMYDARVALAILEHTMKMANYRAELEILKTQGRLAPEVLDKLENTLNWLAGIDPTRFVSNNNNTTGDETRRISNSARLGRTTFIGYDAQETATALTSVSDALQRATDLLNRYRDEALSPYQRDLNQFHEEWEIIFDQYGRGTDIMAEHGAALIRLNDRYDDSLENFYERINGGEFGGVDLQTQYQRSLTNWGQLSAAIQSGDLSQSDAYVDQGERLLDLLSRIGGSTSFEYGNLRDQIEEQLAQVLNINPNSISSSSNLGLSAASLLSNSANDSSNQQVVSRLDLSVNYLSQISSAVRSPTVGIYQSQFNGGGSNGGGNSSGFSIGDNSNDLRERLKRT